MADIVSPAKRSKMMAGIKGKNTRPEIAIRKGLYASGVRFRLHVKGLLGKPDIVIRKNKVLVFINGCFWHGHEACSLFRIPKSNASFWEKKITGNKQRDSKNLAALLSEGWRIVVIWECSLKGRDKLPLDKVIAAVRSFVLSPYPVELEIGAAVPDGSFSTSPVRGGSPR